MTERIAYNEYAKLKYNTINNNENLSISPRPRSQYISLYICACAY